VALKQPRVVFIVVVSFVIRGFLRSGNEKALARPAKN
jgi:hypothetical protein